jgi:hypothetical protein
MAAVVFAEQSGDTEDILHVSGKAVVFFSPSWAEYVSMSDKEKDLIDTELYEFHHYRNKVLSFLKSRKIQVFLTARSKIQIQFAGNESITYFRRGFDHVVGLIMTDGEHEPEVFLGAATDSDLTSMFKAYFGLT